MIKFTKIYQKTYLDTACHESFLCEGLFLRNVQIIRLKIQKVEATVENHIFLYNYQLSMLPFLLNFVKYYNILTGLNKYSNYDQSLTSLLHVKNHNLLMRTLTIHLIYHVI